MTHETNGPVPEVFSTAQYRNNQLFIEEVNVSELAQAWGTPTYVYSRSAIVSAYKQFDDPWQDVDHTVCYAVKANSNLSILRLLGELGAGFDIVSGGELERVIRACGHASKVVFSGVGKTASEISAALEADILCFNVESAGELTLIEQIAREKNRSARISIRFNPDVDPKTHPYIATGLKNNKFGVNREEAIRLYCLARDSAHLDVMGIDCHIGSQITEITPFTQALEKILDLAAELEEKQIPIRHIDLGGGLGVRYKDEPEVDAEVYASAIKQILGRKLSQIHLLFEPGRYLMANAGWLITRVLYLKDNGDKHFAIIDAAMNDLLRPALYESWQAVMPAVIGDSHRTLHNVDLVGPVCESGDYLAKDRSLSVCPGDLLAICSAGAYGFSMSSNYNTRVRPAELLIDGTTIRCIRKRETIDELLRLELQ